MDGEGAGEEEAAVVVVDSSAATVEEMKNRAAAISRRAIGRVFILLGLWSESDDSMRFYL